MKRLVLALLVVTVCVHAGCGGQEGSSADQDQAAQPPRLGIHMAALQGNLEATMQHIKAGSDLNQKDSFGSTPLIIATTFGNAEIAKALIEAGADLTIRSNDGATPLHVAAFLCRVEIVESLLKKGTDKSATDNAGSTPLESVAGPFEQVKPYYDGIGKALKPMGLDLDYERIKQTRPRIAELLQ